MGSMFMNAPALYTADEVAQLTQLSKCQVYRLSDRGEIPGRVKGLGRVLRFSRVAVDSWLLGQTQATAG